MANQLHLDAQSFSHYRNKRSQWDQMREIRSVYGYKTLQIIRHIGNSSDGYMHALGYIMNDQVYYLI